MTLTRRVFDQHDRARPEAALFAVTSLDFDLPRQVDDELASRRAVEVEVVAGRVRAHVPRGKRHLVRDHARVRVADLALFEVRLAAGVGVETDVFEAWHAFLLASD